MKDNPSLRREVRELVAMMFDRFAQFPIDELVGRGELDEKLRNEILALPYTAEQVLGHWYPNEAAVMRPPSR